MFVFVCAVLQVFVAWRSTEMALLRYFVPKENGIPSAAVERTGEQAKRDKLGSESTLATCCKVSYCSK